MQVACLRMHDRTNALSDRQYAYPAVGAYLSRVYRIFWGLRKKASNGTSGGS